eukprot:356309-Prorocentrum_minimum.AAC.1
MALNTPLMALNPPVMAGERAGEADPCGAHPRAPLQPPEEADASRGGQGEGAGGPAGQPRGRVRQGAPLNKLN